MLKTNGTLLLLLPAAGHGHNLHGACSLTMYVYGSTEDVLRLLSSVLSSALSSPRYCSGLRHRLSLSF